MALILKLEQINLYDLAFNNASIGMALISRTGGFIKVNDFLCDMLGYEMDEVLAFDFQTITHPEDLDMNMKYVASILGGEIDAYHMEKRYIHKLGHSVWAMLIVSVIRDAYGKPLFFFSQIHDITAAKQAEWIQLQTEAMLKEKEESFYRLLEELPDGVFIFQNDSFQYLNNAGVQIIGANSMEQALNLTLQGVISTEYQMQMQASRQELWKSGKVGPEEYGFPCLNGETKYVDITLMLTTYNGEQAVLGVFRDITERKTSIERAIRSDKMSMIGQLAAGIAHEIRNPLTSINGFIRLMRNSKAEKDQYYEIIESELKRIEFIANELLILAKPNVVQFQRICLRDLLEQVTALMCVQATMVDVEIVNEWMADGMWIYGEPNQIKQVFINLIKNGIEAMANGGQIRLTAGRDDHFVSILIQDQGCGIPPDKIALLGQPFYTTKDSGTGLGLMITYNLVHHHGGIITVESSESTGTTFCVKLPLHEG
jgi:two-component system sporulation sensor kinase A